MSSFAEFDEEPLLETKALERLHAKSTLLSPEQIASAPLYLTAVIEYVRSCLSLIIATRANMPTFLLLDRHICQYDSFPFAVSSCMLMLDCSHVAKTCAIKYR